MPLKVLLPLVDQARAAELLGVDAHLAELEAFAASGLVETTGTR